MSDYYRAPVEKGSRSRMNVVFRLPYDDVVAMWKVPISIGLAAAGVVAAIIPGGPFLLERRLVRLDT
mgnify:CR=1 FL=1